MNKALVFLADDDPEDRLFFSAAITDFKEVSVELMMFEDGVLLIDYLNNCEILPDIIFLDLNMPRKSGMECLKEIRQNDRLKKISVAIYSTSSSEQDIEDTFVAGANVYIKKPNDFNMLKKVLSDVVHINWQYIVDGLNKDSFILSL